MMQRIPFLLAIAGLFMSLFLIQINLQAQEAVEVDTFSRNKIPVLVEPMQFPENTPPRLVERIQLIAYRTLEQHWHFQVINHSEEENTGEVDPEYIFQLSLQPLIDDLGQRDVKDSNDVHVETKYYVKSGMRLNLRVTNIVTGELKYSQDVESIASSTGTKSFRPPTMRFVNTDTRVASRFTNTGLGPGAGYPFPKSPEAEAQMLQEEKNRLLMKALDDFPGIWQRTLSGLFPVAIHLVEVINGSETKPKKIRIDAGEDFGVRIGYPMDLYTYKVYRAMGEEFVREETLGNFYPADIQADHTIGRIIGGRKDVGEALARGEQIFLRFRNYPNFR